MKCVCGLRDPAQVRFGICTVCNGGKEDCKSSVSVTECVFCDVTNTDEDQVGVWCVKCQRALRIKWS